MTEVQQKKTLGIAVTSLVMGCLFLVPLLGILFSLAAITLGIIAVVKISNNPNVLKGKGLAISGIVLGSLGVLMIPVLFFSAIAIPNFLRVRIKANEAAATARIQAASKAIETYIFDNDGAYPISEEDLINATPPYMSSVSKDTMGYNYIFDFSGSNYEITAIPVKCMVTGTKVFRLNQREGFFESDC